MAEDMKYQICICIFIILSQKEILLVCCLTKISCKCYEKATYVLWCTLQKCFNFMFGFQKGHESCYPNVLGVLIPFWKYIWGQFLGLEISAPQNHDLKNEKLILLPQGRQSGRQEEARLFPSTWPPPSLPQYSFGVLPCFSFIWFHMFVLHNLFMTEIFMKWILNKIQPLNVFMRIVDSAAK